MLDLEGVDGSPSITLAGVIPSHGFYLLSRTDETTLSDCAANQIYSGAMANTGENFQLADPGGTVRDAVDCSGGWFAGSSAAKTSMERRHPGLDGAYASSWASNTTVVRNGLDSQGGAVNGTPGQPNSVFDSSLPVELELFTAAWQQGKVILEWSVQSQVNNHGYKVLRSDTETDPGHCISGLIAGDGTTSERKRYRLKTTGSFKAAATGISCSSWIWTAAANCTVPSAFSPVMAALSCQTKIVFWPVIQIRSIPT